MGIFTYGKNAYSLFCVLWLVVKICVATIGVCVFGAQASVCALFVFGGKMKKNIEALWMGRPIPLTLSDEEQAIFAEKRTQLRQAYSQLEKHLDGDGKRLLLEYLSKESIVNEIERKNAFVYGFSLGVKLIAEGLEE